MDQDLQRKIDEARAQGYTDEEINAYLSNKPVEQQAPMDRSEEYKGLAQGVGLEAAMLGGQAAAIGAGAYGAKKLIDKFGENLRQPPAAGQAAMQQGAQQAMRATGTEGGSRAMGDMARQLGGQPQGGAIRPDNTVRLRTPAGVPVTNPNISMLDKASAMVRQLAANKVLQNAAKIGAGGLALMGGGVAFAGQPSDLGPRVPQSGRMRGMEINPMTGRPWSQQELTMYEQNPSAFDSLVMGQQR